MGQPQHTGHCLCRKYHFTAAGDPVWVAHCHCESCRRATGAPIVTYTGFLKTQVEFTPEPPEFASSPTVRRAFCEQCGSALTYTAQWCEDEVHLIRDNFVAPEAFTATRHVFFNEHHADFDCYDDLPRYGSDSNAALAWGRKPACRILFLCTGNSARSILAEGIVNSMQAMLGGERVIAHSAGSQPAAEVNPAALELLAGRAYLTDRLRSKSWDEFSVAAGLQEPAPNGPRPQPPELSWVITLCDKTAKEDLPLFPGSPQQLHWGLPDPAAGAASFAETFAVLEAKVQTFLKEIGAGSSATTPSAPH